ncbi:MAG TPA: acyltransferase family protein [Acidimicrobiales bacterium]|nr:acyltransferase family protein [Acidimicrobiales bacterium]
MRTVAVYLVVAYHSGVPMVGGGFIGVDLFFVLSGFLVTSVLLAEARLRGGISILRFYGRRARRLLPAAVLVVCATSALQVLVASAPRRAQMLDDARAALLYVANWQFVADSRSYFATDRSPFTHYWSLSIEEQFYVALPVVLWLVWRRSRTPVRTLALVAGTAVALSLALQVWRAATDATHAYYGTDTRLYQPAAGVVLACLISPEIAGRSGRRRRHGAASAVAGVGLSVLVVLATGLEGLPASWRGTGATVGSLLLLAGLHGAPRGPLGRVLALEPIRYVGTISYAIYLWHWPVVLVLDSVLDVGPPALAAGVMTVSTGLAALSDRLLERPVRTSGVLAARPAMVVAGGLTVSVTAALLVVEPVLSSPRRPALASIGASPSLAALGAAADVLRQPVPEDLDLVAAKGDIPDSGGICTTDDRSSCLRVRGDPDGLGVVLVGDSHAAMLMDAFTELAVERGWTLHTSVLSACAWQQGLRNERSRPDAQALCRTARDDFYADVLPALDADVVVAVGLSRSAERWEHELSAVDAPPGETLVERQLRTSRDTAAAITGTGVPLVIVTSILGTGGYDRGPDPLDCLARARILADCAVVPPLAKPPVDGIYETLAAESDAITTVDFNPAICLTPPLCQPVRGRTVIWRDWDHITSRFAVEQRHDLLARLAEARPAPEW